MMLTPSNAIQALIDAEGLHTFDYSRWGYTGYGIDPEAFVHSIIILRACNTMSTNVHHWPFIAEAQRRGAKVVVIDPMRSRTAKAADWHIPI